MSKIADPLAKPVWPTVDASIQEAIVSGICTVLAPLKKVQDAADVPDSFADILLGFNSTMAAIEEHVGGGRKLAAIFVCRDDLSPEVTAPFGLASAVVNIPLLALPAGTVARLSEAAGREVGIVGLRAVDAPWAKNILSMTGNVRAAQVSPAYTRASLVPRDRKSTKRQ